MSKVQITCETENANIYYTLNGENPTSNSTLYSSPFEVNESCTVKAIGYKESYLESDVLEKDLIKLPTPILSDLQWSVMGSPDCNVFVEGFPTLTAEHFYYHSHGQVGSDYQIANDSQITNLGEGNYRFKFLDNSIWTGSVTESIQIKNVNGYLDSDIGTIGYP